MLWPLRWFVFEMLEKFRDVFGHGDVEILFLVVPIKHDSTVEGACPIFRDGVMLVYGVDQVVRIFFSNVLDTKIIYTKCKLH